MAAMKPEAAGNCDVSGGEGEYKVERNGSVTRNMDLWK